MNIVDLHNKLRQGVVAMADVWLTISWAERHFAEGIGLWEVNVFKALVYFFAADWGGLPHSEFRQRLAWAFMTLGKVPYPTAPGAKVRPGDGAAPAPMPASSTSSSSSSPPAVDKDAPLPDDNAHHQYVRYQKHGFARTCGHCGKLAFQYCILCEHRGLGHFPVCGVKSKRDCMAQHADGKVRKHASWNRATPVTIPTTPYFAPTYPYLPLPFGKGTPRYIGRGMVTVNIVPEVFVNH